MLLPVYFLRLESTRILLLWLFSQFLLFSFQSINVQMHFFAEKKKKKKFVQTFSLKEKK
jgi:hypothetical protein